MSCKSARLSAEERLFWVGSNCRWVGKHGHWVGKHGHWVGKHGHWVGKHRHWVVSLFHTQRSSSLMAVASWKSCWWWCCWSCPSSWCLSAGTGPCWKPPLCNIQNTQKVIFWNVKFCNFNTTGASNFPKHKTLLFSYIDLLGRFDWLHLIGWLLGLPYAL